MKADSEEVETGRCIRGSDLKLCFSEKVVVTKVCVERIMTPAVGWDHEKQGDAVNGPIDCVSRDEVLQTLYEMKTRDVPAPSDVLLELILSVRN